MISILKGILHGCWTLLDFTRRAFMNLIFLIVLGVVLGWIVLALQTEKAAPGTVLVIPVEGAVVDSRQSASRESLLARLTSESPRETLLRDVVEALDLAAADPAISGVLMRLDDLSRIGMASIHEIGNAMDRFKGTGKRITVWSGGFSQRQYAIAAHASNVYLHPMGQVMLTGVASSRLYWGELLKKAGVTVHVFKAGAYKTFPEPYVLSAPSKESLEADRYWMTDAWAQLADSMQRARGLMPGTISEMIDTLPATLKELAGDMSAVALKANLVDGLKTRDEVNDLLVERQGGKKGKDSLRTIDYRDYLAGSPASAAKGKFIAVVTLEGEIRDGNSGFGGVGDRTVADQIRAVRLEPDAAALVLRVDSPGGSAVASEMIRCELELVRKDGKPVVVSMGDTAASGGYWVSLASDVIVADPMTITGSIGVFGMMPTFEKTLEKLFVGTGGVSTTWLADARDLSQAMDPRFEAVMGLTVERTYRDFISLVAKARKLPVAKVSNLAQGRVYTGRQAAQLGLVDKLGGLETAFDEARRLARLDAAVKPLWVEPETSFIDFWIDRLTAQAAGVFDIRGAVREAVGIDPSVIKPVVTDFSGLVRLPQEPLAHCMCQPNL